MAQLSHPYMTTRKIIALTRRTFVGKVMSLIFNMLSRLVIAFLPRSKHLLISWLRSPSAVILEPQNKVSHCFHCFPIYLSWRDGSGCHDLSFLNVDFYLFTLIKRLFSSSWLSAIRVVSSAYLWSLIFLPAILIPACASSSPASCMMYSALGFPDSSVGKESACNAGDPVRFLGLENPLEKGKATHSSILA